jgi:hypothetical protein
MAIRVPDTVTSLREAARAIYDTVYPSQEWAPVGFDEAERHDTIHYRNALCAARTASMLFSETGDGRLL